MLYTTLPVPYTVGMDSVSSSGGGAVPGPAADAGRIVPFFAALCLFLSAVEYAIPKPLPFLRLGLANLPLLLALPKLRSRHILLLVLLKTVGQGIISGTLFSYVSAFSVAGSCASAAGMILVYHVFIRNRSKPLLGFTGVSLTGALCSNGAQLLLARYLLFGSATRYIAPVLLCTGTVTGLLLGLFASQFAARSRWYASLEGAS